jgi:polysaccharide biosynthesis transport protein
MFPHYTAPNGHANGALRAPEAPLYSPQESMLAEGIRVFRKRWPVFSLTALLCFAAALAVVKWQTPVYRATASLLVQGGQKGAGGSPDLPVVGDLLGLGAGRSVQTQVEVLRSESLQQRVMDKVDRELGIDLPEEEDPKVRIQSVRDTDLISVTVDDPNRQRASRVATSLMDTYLEENMSLNRQTMRSARVFVGKHRTQIQKQLAKAELDLKRYQEQTGAIALEEATVERIKHLEEMQSARHRLQGELAAAQAEQRVVEQQLRKIQPKVLAASRVTENPVVGQLRGEIAKLAVEKAGLLKEYTPESPEVQAVDEKIREAEARIGTVAERVIAQEEQAINPVHQEVQKHRAAALAKAAALLPQFQSLAAPIQEEERALRAVPERSRRLIQLKRKVLSLDKIAALLDAKFHELQISEAAQLAGARIVDPARLKKKPVRPNVPLTLSFGACLGVLLGLAVIFCLEQLDRSVHNAEEVQGGLGVPVLGTVPRLRLQGKRASESMLKELPAAESFRMVRTSLQFASLGKPLKRVLVTSAIPGEGKSTTSIHLAAALAQKGMKVVLIDADLRRPSLHTKLKLPNAAGLSSAIVGGEDVKSLLMITPYPNVLFLPAGPTPPNPAELLDSEGALRVMDRLLEDADLLLIDSPPCSGLADAAILAPKCDGVVFVVKAGSTDRSLCHRALTILRESGSRLFGVVLNQAGTARDHYYYSYKNKNSDTRQAALEPPVSPRS